MTVGAGCSRSTAWAGQLPPGEVRLDSVHHHLFRDAGDSCNRWRNVLAAGKGDQARLRNPRADARPADLEEMPTRSGGCGLTVDGKRVELRQRQRETRAHHHPA